MNISSPEMTLTQVVRKGFEQACRQFTARVEPLGFHRTRKTFWTRRHDHTVDLIHFHRGGSSYGAPLNASIDIRVHFGIRVLNDDFVAAALNGPYSDPGRLRSGRYHLRFNAQTGSTFERCTDDLARFLVEQGEPWFRRFQTIENLLQLGDSPLMPHEKELLRASLEGRANADNVVTSLKILGIKGK